MTRKFSCILNLAFLLVACLAPRSAPAADWPQRTITLIQPFGAGGVTDRIGRVLAEYLSQELGVPVIVETRPGAGGALGSSQVARALPDGYTLLVSGLASQVTSPLVTPNPNFDTLAELHAHRISGRPAYRVGGSSLHRDEVGRRRRRSREGRGGHFLCLAGCRNARAPCRGTGKLEGRDRNQSHSVQ